VNEREPKTEELTEQSTEDTEESTEETEESGKSEDTEDTYEHEGLDEAKYLAILNARIENAQSESERVDHEARRANLLDKLRSESVMKKIKGIATALVLLTFLLASSCSAIKGAQDTKYDQLREQLNGVVAEVTRLKEAGAPWAEILAAIGGSGLLGFLGINSVRKNDFEKIAKQVNGTKETGKKT
jgi:hypothetical protein